MVLVLDGIDELTARVGERLGYSSWIRVGQDRISLFAEATEDHQWIHTDPERASKESPYGSTIAHGFLTLSLIPRLQSDVYRVRGVKMGLNYGCDRVRFVSPVPVDSDLRLGVELLRAEPVSAGITQVAFRFTIEVRDHPKPACVADVLFRYFQ